jgi:molybdate transport system ATP-binding protein
MIILVMSRVDVMPPFITHVIPVEGLNVLPKVPVKEFTVPTLQESHPSLSGHREDSPEIIRMNKVTIRYGDRTILRDFDWTVREGERWALTGENGSGKSTLLSLVCADNPQGYACDISLFGHRRGTGESIWDIKRHIGYVSPEMHRAYQKNIAALDIVASGLFDTVGMFMHPTESQLDTCRRWMLVFGIEGLAERPYLRLSSGEQRLCLLARAFVKDPELLILDEPMHGLDLHHCARVKDIIDSFAQHPGKTLVMVSHYESELPSCIDHRLVLTRNR